MNREKKKAFAVKILGGIQQKARKVGNIPINFSLILSHIDRRIKENE
ncbi:TPA: hypothetical protein ACNHTV_001586 [Enterococcus faecalis]